MTVHKAYKKEIEKKCKLPEENMEYTFIFPGQRYVTYTYCGQNAKGRLILYNVKQKTFSSMSPGWFNALIGKRKQLVSKRPVGELSKTCADTNQQKPLYEQLTIEEPYEQRSIRELRELSPALAFSVQSAIGYPPAELAVNLESVHKDKNGEIYNDVFVARCFCDLMKAQGIYHTKKNNLTL